MDVSGKASRQAVPGIDEHMDFQHREWRWQRVGRVALGLLVFGACLGLVGGAGPLNRTAAGAADGSLLVEYDRFVRVGAVTTVRLAVASAGVDACLLGPALLDRMDIERIVPAPVEVVHEREAVRLRFDPPLAAGASVTIDAVPTRPGRVDSWAALEGHRPAPFASFAIF